MAKGKKVNKKLVAQPQKNFQAWLINRTAEARKLGEHPAARAAGRWGSPAGVALVILIFAGSLLIPKDNIKEIKERLAKNPNDFETHLQLVEAFLNNNQFEEAEKTLLLAQKQLDNADNKVLGEQTSQKFEELWQRKHYSDPKDIRRLITAWEEIVKEKPHYRDGYLQLAYLHYKIFENEKAKEYLQKAIELDPNYEPARELEEILSK